ncbi:replication factor A protein 3 [Rhodocollybia butyracea]|uniref:Replication factor A protein 3 n=1 Tax=Rhodocollybia butyracea TaxID=206335 RepID=A0A9P5Q147_9AGAR|nr:replication factor A protein 3 [Rhodocollybia butyracea]
MSEISPRVNSAILPRFIGQIVRIPCKILTTTENTVTVQTSDGGEILVKFTGDSGITTTFVEIIGHVVDATTVRKAGVINLKSDLDLQVADKVIKLIHDPRFFSTIFS